MTVTKEPRTSDPSPATAGVRLLLVDDDAPFRKALARALERRHHQVITAGSSTEALERNARHEFDVALLDFRMPGLDGIALMQELKRANPDLEVVILTGHGTIPSAIEAIQRGAFHYLTKPCEVADVELVLRNAVRQRQLAMENARLREAIRLSAPYEGIVGRSPGIMEVFEVIERTKESWSPVLIQGESGTGKELVARALHQNSARKNKPFVPLNISALPESILESELFGHEQGAFTGAASKRIGKIEHANGGTLFLDEVGEMPMETQIKLLRVLEDRKITRLGSNEEKAINVRLLAATNADLKQMVEAGTFRRDLFYRLSVVSITLPPLRERRGDIPLLIDHFLKDLQQRHGRTVEGVSGRARQALTAYDWPGNIRQLRNVVEGMLALDTDGVLDIDDLPEEIAPLAGDGTAGLTPAAAGADGLIGRPLEEVEAFYIARALELTGGKREEAAKLLGIGERTLYRKIKEYGLRD